MPLGAQDDTSKSSKKEDKKTDNRHHRVFTRSTCYYATITLKIINAELPGKKSISPFVRVYFGSTGFVTAVKKKTVTPQWDEEFTSTVDREDVVQLKVWDNGKLERNMDNAKVIEPICKKKVSVKELTLNGDVDKVKKTFELVGGGSLHTELSIIINHPKVGEVHTKQFNYPTWTHDRYNINQVPPTMDGYITAVKTASRYITRWMLNQRAIMASINNDSSEEEDNANDNKNETPEGLSFELLDISACSHDKAVQFNVTFTWRDDKIKEVNANDEWESTPNTLTFKIFSTETKIPKKKVYHYKALHPTSYQDIFGNICDGTNEVIVEAMKWLNSNRESYSKVFKFIPVTTPLSHHVVVFYYR